MKIKSHICFAVLVWVVALLSEGNLRASNSWIGEVRSYRDGERTPVKFTLTDGSKVDLTITKRGEKVTVALPGAPGDSPCMHYSFEGGAGHIHTISVRKNCSEVESKDGKKSQPSGNGMLQIVDELSSRGNFNISRNSVQDDSKIMIRGTEVWASLKWVHLFRKGESWYESKGYFVADYSSYLRAKKEVLGLRMSKVVAEITAAQTAGAYDKRFLSTIYPEFVKATPSRFRPRTAQDFFKWVLEHPEYKKEFNEVLGTLKQDKYSWGDSYRRIDSEVMLAKETVPAEPRSSAEIRGARAPQGYLPGSRGRKRAIGIADLLRGAVRRESR